MDARLPEKDVTSTGEILTPQSGALRSYSRSNDSRANDDLLLTESSRQLLAVTAPPVAIQCVAHDLEADDLIAADDASFVGPDARSPATA